MANEAIMDRIAKLLAMAKGTNNEHEAASFMDKAAEMLAQHNLTEAQIAARQSGKDDPIGPKPYDAPLYSWNKAMVVAAGKLYFCRVINDRQAGKYILFGREANATVAVHMVKYLMATICRLSREYAPDSKAVQEDFRRGAATRMTERLMTMYKEKAAPAVQPVAGDRSVPALYANEMALAKAAAEAHYGRLKAGKPRKGIALKGHGAAAGYERANSISLNTQIRETRAERMIGSK